MQTLSGLRRVMATLLPLAALAVPCISASPGSVAQTLKVGYGRVNPITYKGKDGRAAGFAVDVLNEAAEREGIALVWLTTDNSAASEQMLGAGRIDLMAAGMITPERQRRFYVSEPWWSVELTLLARADIQGGVKRLALSPIYQFLARKAYPHAVLISKPWLEDNVSAVCTGEADAALISHGELHAVYMNRPPACANVALDSGDTDTIIELAVIARSADAAIAKRLRSRIDDMALDGTLLRLAGKHPPISTAGAVRLASQVQERSRGYIWTIAVFLIIPAAIWAALDERRRRTPGITVSVADVLPRPSRRYLFAVSISLAAIGIRMLARPVVGSPGVFLFESFAVAAAAQYGGIGAGLAATSVCVLLSGALFPKPLFLGLFPKQPADVVAIGIFVLLAVSLSYLGERLITAKRLRLNAERDNEVQREHAAALKGAEEQVAAQKAQLEALLESVAEPIFVTDREGTVLMANAAFRSLFAVRKTVGEYVPQEELRTLGGNLVQPEMWPIHRLLRGETIRNMELELRRLDGEPLIISYSGNPVLDERGQVAQVILTLQDITERKRLEEALRESEERLRLTLEGAGIGTFDYRPLTGEIFMDERTRDLWGLHEGEPIDAAEAARRIHKADLQRVCDHVAAAIEPSSSGAVECEYRIVLPDGRVHWTVAKGRAHFEGHGRERKAVRLVGIHLDVTERKVLRGLLPTCAHCKNIRDQQGRWHKFEEYITSHSQAKFSHGICPDCVKELYEGIEAG